MSTLLTILLSVSGACGALITIGGFVTMIMKKPRKWIKDLAQEACAEDFKDIRENYSKDMGEIKELIGQINDKLTSYSKTNICSLRHDITVIYETYKSEKKLPAYIKQDVCRLYERYTAEGGNSYVHTIVDEMMEWTEE